MIPYGKQYIDDDDIAAVVEVLKSDWLTCGPAVSRFEKALADYCGAKHAIAVANGTAALHVAMLAAGIKAGDRVLTSANTFLASANCAEYVGATADFADIDPRTYNVTAETLGAAWKSDVRAIVPVDFAGQPCDMPTIAALARERGALIIEDASHAIGSQVQHKGKWYKTGGHAWADLTTFSFHPVKTMTTGEGGAVITNDDKLAQRCRMFRSHGMIRDASHFVGLSAPANSRFTEYGPWYYEMHELGYNYRLTDIQCALGHSQLRKLDALIERRAEIARKYNVAFSDLSGVQLPSIDAGNMSAWHLYALQIDFSAIGKSRTTFVEELKKQGIGCQVHYIPVYLQEYYRKRYGYMLGKCAVAEKCYPGSLSIPLFPSMTDDDVSRVVRAVLATV